MTTQPTRTSSSSSLLSLSSLRRRARAALVAWTLASVWLPSGSADAAFITVTTTDDELNTDGDCSLREAISAANHDAPYDACGAGSGADTIRLGAGIYDLTIEGPGEDDNLTGDLDIRTSMTITGSGPGTKSIRQMPPNQYDRVFHVRCNDTLLTDIDVSFFGLEIVLGVPPNGSSGGGILIEDCGGPNGGDSNVVIDGMEFFANLVTHGGGAIGDLTSGFVTIRNSTFLENYTTELNDPNPLPGGGAIRIDGGGLTTVEDCVFESNHAVGNAGGAGGAIYVASASNIRRSTFWENGAPEGAAIACRNATMNLDNSTLGRNDGPGAQAGFNGLDPCTLSVASSTIAENSTGGLVNEAGLVTLENTVVFRNGPLQTSVDVVGTFTSGGRNIVGNGDNLFGIWDISDYIGTAGSEFNPGMSAFGHHGDAVPHYRPGLESAALDTGTTIFANDVRGAPRPALAADDRGAVERQTYDWGIYIDLGQGAGVPTAYYGAAVGTPGEWNALTIANGQSVFDRDGHSLGSLVQVDFDTDTDVDLATIPGTTDDERLFGDHAYDCSAPEGWTFSITGLIPGDYEVYVYAPYRSDLFSGNTGFGGPVYQLPGDLLTSVEDVSYLSASVTSFGGVIAIVSGDTFNNPDCVGVSGIQIVPEPGVAAGLMTGGLLAGTLSRRRSSRRRRGRA